MTLKEVLRKSGYDLINSPIRNHKPLQLWLKKPGNSVELYYEHVTHALSSPIDLTLIEDSALTVDYTQDQEYTFNVGITVLEELLTSLGLGNLALSSTFSSGKNVKISYDNSKTIIIPTGEISDYLSKSDFVHPNRDLLNNANRDNILIITGILSAKNLRAVIETTAKIEAEIEAALNKIGEGKATFKLVSDKTLNMTSEGNIPFPIAVKASRIDWDKTHFKKLVIVTDNKYLF